MPDLTGKPTSSLDNMQAHDSQISKILVGSDLHQLCNLSCMLQSTLSRLHDVWTLEIRPRCGSLPHSAWCFSPSINYSVLFERA
ncbi:hypothetical protein IG631_14306 [Alternaria alternata]|nr:hypothetical protein IG631_14306 [Alternaria alternata]